MNMNKKVVNLSDKLFTGEVIRVDRKTALGNPFNMKTAKDRDRVIEGFRKYLFLVAVKEASPEKAANLISEKMGLSISRAWINPSRDLFMANLDLLVLAIAGTGETGIGCHCSPNRCHGDVLLSYANWKIHG